MPADAPVGSKRPAPETARPGPARAPAAGPPPPPGSAAKRPRAPVAPAESRGDASAAPGAMAGRAPSLPARYLLRVQYDGTNFHGFQRQAKARTVQGCVEDALSRFVGGKSEKVDEADTGVSRSVGVLTHGSSRTDAGVHALDATLHVDLERVSKRKPNQTPKPFTARTVMSAANHFLKRAGHADVRVWACVRVDPEKFHARYSATARTYTYRIKVSSSHKPPGVFEKGKVWHVVRDEPLDVDTMRRAADMLIGAHDFSSFRASGCQAKSATRTVDAIEVVNDDAFTNAFDPEATRLGRAWDDDLSEVEIVDDEGPLADANLAKKNQSAKQKNAVSSSVAITARAPSFLYHQVRLMVGTLVAVGVGDMTPADVKALLEKKDVSQAPTMAPACGLYLARVHYDGSRKWDATRGAGGA
jgi:tRNA pseudouridine38-40 synthase